MSLRGFLGVMPVRDFLGRHYFHLPLGRPGGAVFALPLADPDLLDRLLEAPGVDAFLARDRHLWSGGSSPDASTAQRLAADGWTVVVRDAQKHDAGLARLAGDFSRDFAAPVNVHFYSTPAGRTGFGWHYDVEDVFVLQIRGIKEFQLRKNTVNPWPLRETLAKDLAFEREISPVWKARLGPGDGLYIPFGWWHCAWGVEGPSESLSVGLMSPSALEVIDVLRRELLGNPAWRRRLPVSGAAAAEGVGPSYEALFRDLGRDLARALSDGAVARRFLSTRGADV